MCTEGEGKEIRHGSPFRGHHGRAAPSSRLVLAGGFSLIEAVMFMVVVGLALAAVINAYSLANRASADPVLTRQSLAIAQALLEEISYKAFSNPTDGYSDPEGDGVPNPAARDRFDDIHDYDGLALTGLDLPGLERYAVAVTVAAAALGNVPASAGWRITVTVTDPAGRSLSLDGYRTDY